MASSAPPVCAEEGQPHQQQQQDEFLAPVASVPSPIGTQPTTTVAERKFDRDWLRRLLLKHAHNHPNMPQDLVDKALVVAPMVDASDLPYRLLTRRYNTSLCFTPMIHAKMFIDKPGYQKKFWKVPSGMPSHDRPLIAQFCGYDKDVLLQAMKIVEKDVDGVDINCGCPQNIAKRGGYGAFLMEEEGGDRIVEIVRHLSANLNVPVSVKLRILPSGVEDSLKLYKRLVDAGASMLTIHGRTRHQRQFLTGSADWNAIKDVVRLVGERVPVLANGSISNMDDVRKCLEETGVDGIMSSEAILEYPPLFTETNVQSTDNKRTGPGRLQMAQDYLDFCKEFPPDEGGQGTGMKCVRAHLHRFLHKDLQTHTNVRDAVVKTFSMEAAHNAVAMVREIHEKEGHDIENEQLSWYVRHRREWEEGWDGGGDEDNGYGEEKKSTSMKEEDDDGECCMCDEDAAEARDILFGGGATNSNDGDY